jgi:hypothetical protein
MIADVGEIKAQPPHWREHASPEIEDTARGAVSEQLSELMDKDTADRVQKACAERSRQNRLESAAVGRRPRFARSP